MASEADDFDLIFQAQANLDANNMDPGIAGTCIPRPRRFIFQLCRLWQSLAVLNNL
jgi:hypothetical protein